MHHFIYSSNDTFITNRSGLTDKNFGVDEILQIGTTNKPIAILSQTKDYVYINQIFNNSPVQSFTGIFTGSFGGDAVDSLGILSGSNLWFSASYFNGTVNGVPMVGSGSVSGSLIQGIVSGSLIVPFLTGIYTGQLSGSDVCLTGTGSGIDRHTEPNWTTTSSQNIDRSIILFNLTKISESIAKGDIVNPKFFLNLKVCNEYQLPINYVIYAAPISQSWDNGNGYLSDGGSSVGASWYYRNSSDGIEWYNPKIIGSRYAINFISDPSLLSASFGMGGGTWYSESYCSQSFGNQSADIKMDVTSIVNGWLSGNYENNGFILFSSDELNATGSGFILKYFSRDTNTIYSPYLDVSWNDAVFITSSLMTSSIVITTVSSGISSSISNGSSMTIAGGLSGSFSGSAILTLVPNYSESVMLSYYSASGFTVSEGLGGNILGIPLIGNVDAIVSVSQSLITGPCGNSFYTQLATGSLTTGIFSGSTFTAYYVDHKFENGWLTGSWTEAALIGSTVNISIPSNIEPYTYAYVNGVYVNGKALGTYLLSGSNSASFNGQFIDGNLFGASLQLQLSGTIVTASYSYTSSIQISSSVLTQLDIKYPFTINVQNMQPTYVAGDLVKISIFGRKKYPQKYFGRSTQQEQYMIPEILPSSSFYALKDNQTDEIVVDFDSYTQISCEYPYGNYFLLDTTGLPQERYYRVLIRVNDSNNSYTVDTGKIFKIIRGGSPALTDQ